MKHTRLFAHGRSNIIFSQHYSRSCRRQRQLRQWQSPSLRNRVFGLQFSFLILDSNNLSQLHLLAWVFRHERKCPLAAVERKNFSRPLTAQMVSIICMRSKAIIHELSFNYTAGEAVFYFTRKLKETQSRRFVKFVMTFGLVREECFSSLMFVFWT